MKLEYLFLKKEDDFYKSIDSFKSLLKTNSRIELKDSSLIYKQYFINFSLRTNIIKDSKERCFHLILSHSNNDDELNANILSKFGAVIYRIIERAKKFNIYIIYDEASQFYCKKGYPLINEIESLMRKLIYVFMIKNMGDDGFTKSFPKELHERVKKTNKNELVKNYLNEFDFCHLGCFLFNKYSKKKDDVKLFGIIDSIKTIDDLNIAKRTLIDYKPESNWSRYFSSIIKYEKLEEKWDKLYQFRNIIAHNKLFTKKEFDEMLKVIEETKLVIIQAIDGIDDLKINRSDIFDLQKQLEEIMKNFDPFLFNFAVNSLKSIIDKDL
jgi:hypothetical protein